MKISKQGNVTHINGNGSLLFHFTEFGIELDGVSNIQVVGFSTCRLSGGRLRMAVNAFRTVWRASKGIKGKTE
ncbi:MAG: hypothetical protein GYA32_14940 [Serratia sp.]|nr:hypothetical protein [Serratia sp. (in: enterobacteria)]